MFFSSFPRYALVLFVGSLIGWPPSTRAEAPATAASAKPKEALVREPVAFRVYQRDRDGRADIPVVLDPGAKDASIVSAQLTGLPADATVPFTGGRFAGVPTGGPYQVNVTVNVGGAERALSVGPLFVGDLWLLGGQSNMQGYGDLVDVTPPHPKVMVFGVEGRWTRAEEPLFWLEDAIDPVHFGDPATRAERSRAFHKNRTTGAGLGLPFAVTLVAQTGVPVGLVLCAHGGTNMPQWGPAKKGEGGRSLYGSMQLQARRAGGRVKGMLWYQGEDEANAAASKVYSQVMSAFITALREDLHQPDLPFYLVQITRLVYEHPRIDPMGRNPVREAQRRFPEHVAHTAVVAAIDLELDDLGHVGTHGLKRLGRRLALVALRELYGKPGATAPNLDTVTKAPRDWLLVKFKGVNVRQSDKVGLQPPRHIAGFSIRRADGSEIPLIFNALVGPSPDTVTLRLTGPVPAGAQLWYGYGLNPYCNLTDSADMAVPAFGPVALDGLR